MIRNYFKIAFRNLLRDKIFSFINILGLAFGMASAKTQFFGFLQSQGGIGFFSDHKPMWLFLAVTSNCE